MRATARDISLAGDDIGVAARERREVAAAAGINRQAEKSSRYSATSTAGHVIWRYMRGAARYDDIAVATRRDGYPHAQRSVYAALRGFHAACYQHHITVHCRRCYGSERVSDAASRVIRYGERAKRRKWQA